MKEAKNAVESALLDNQRASPIRATKMNAASHRLFVDFLFVDNCVQIDSRARTRGYQIQPYELKLPRCCARFGYVSASVFTFGAVFQPPRLIKNMIRVTI
jgi:hypothetical protein